MSFRSWTLAVLTVLLLLASAPAWGAPTTVQLRVEGGSSTLFEAPVTTDGHGVDGKDGTGPHPCDGTNAGANPGPGPTMTSALDDSGIGWEGTWFSGFSDFLVNRIGGEAPTGSSFWGTVLNFHPTSVGGCQQRVQAGDEVLFALGSGSEPLLKLTGPRITPIGQPMNVTVTSFEATPGSQESPAPGATIAGANGAQTGPDGSVSISFDSPGVKRLKAEKAGTIRSNSLFVCVPEAGADSCGSSVPPAATGGAPGVIVPPAGVTGRTVRDSKAPVARISGPRNARRYRRGPRLLRGTATDAESGVSEVKLALRRHVRGRSCRWWSGKREKFAGSSCGKRFFFAVGDGPDWSYLLPRRLEPGHYVLDVKAQDRAGNLDEQFERGSNRVVFDVLDRRGRLVGPPGLRGGTRGAGSAPSPPGGTSSRSQAAAPARGAKVNVMVVGRNRVLASARALSAGRRRVRASGRGCLVGASTPLAALVKRLRIAGVRYHVRDFGRCSPRRAGSSAQLFVDRIGGDRNRGQDGWFYKVNHRAGTSGAADPSGLPDGRLRARDRVLWFYCLFETAAASCQQSLEVVPSGRLVRAGETLRVRVVGYRNEGGGAPVAGATVTLGSSSGTTDASGRADLSAGAPGRYLLSAAKPGAVPSFPVRVRVR